MGYQGQASLVASSGIAFFNMMALWTFRPHPGYPVDIRVILRLFRQTGNVDFFHQRAAIRAIVHFALLLAVWDYFRACAEPFHMQVVSLVLEPKPRLHRRREQA
jgi:hypothetical protein